MQVNFLAGFWRLADPKISLASFAGMFMATCFAAVDTGLHPGWLAATVLGVFFIEVAKNAAGELVDFDSGTDLAVTEKDRSPFSGGKRVLVDGLLTTGQTRAIALAFFTLGVAVGLAIVAWREPGVLALGLVGVALAWYYHGGSLRLAYRGWGEVAVAIAYGPLVVNGAYLVQTGAVNLALIHASMILGMLVAAFLWVNEFPDHDADKAAGKHNLVVALGKAKAAQVYVILVLAPFAWLGMLALQYPGAGLWAGLAGLPPVIFSAWRVLVSYDNTRLIIPAQVASLLGFILFAAGTGSGYLLSH